MFTPRVGSADLRSAVAAPVIAAAVLFAVVAESSHAQIAGTLVAVGNGVFAVRLMRLAYIRHRAGTPCRSAGLLGLGMLATAITGATIAVATPKGVPSLRLPYLVVGGLAMAIAAFLPALLLMPGAAQSLTARARHMLDGLGVGICLLFTLWVLVICPNGSLQSLPFWIAFLSSCAVAMAIVTALRIGAARRAVISCSASVAVAVVGLNGLAACLATGYLVGAPLFFAALLLGSAVLAWFGASRITVADMAVATDGGPTLAGYPMLAVPAAIAIAVALHRLISGGHFCRPSLVLGVAGIAVLVLRESLAAMDVSRYARQVVTQEARFRNLVAGSNDVIMVLDPDLVVRWQSSASARQFGLSDQEVVGRHFQSMVHPEDAIYVADRLADVRDGRNGDRPVLIEARLRDGFGQWRETESSAADQLAVPEVGGIVVHIRDVSERKEMERSLHRLAFADQLTGLANRRQVLLTIVAQRCAARVRGALLLVKLDGFHAVNDVRGYDIGDAVLIEVARRLRAATADTGLAARLSGDEFAVVTDASAVRSYALATRLLTMLAEPVVLPGASVHLSASIGMADLAGGDSVDDVLRRANLALRRAKQLGRGRVEWHDSAVEEATLRRETLEQDLPDALPRGELDLIYQPILDLVTQRPTAVEALLRWRHPRLGTLHPVDVIPVAEDLGLIDEIGGWVLRQSGRQLATWLREGRNLSMAVNVSPYQLEDGQLADAVATVLQTNDLPPERVVLEVAEGGIGPDPARVHERLMQVRSLGVRTALDEFGTGAESLTHLRVLPMDMVKIGRTFFDETAVSPGASVPIIDVMVGLGRRLGVEIVAQGLEAPTHLDVVRAAGCRLGQGHLFARPQPAERTEAFLDEMRARVGG